MYLAGLWTASIDPGKWTRTVSSASPRASRDAKTERRVATDPISSNHTFVTTRASETDLRHSPVEKKLHPTRHAKNHRPVMGLERLRGGRAEVLFRGARTRLVTPVSAP